MDWSGVCSDADAVQILVMEKELSMKAKLSI